MTHFGTHRSFQLPSERERERARETDRQTDTEGKKRKGGRERERERERERKRGRKKEREKERERKKRGYLSTNSSLQFREPVQLPRLSSIPIVVPRLRVVDLRWSTCHAISGRGDY